MEFSFNRQSELNLLYNQIMVRENILLFGSTGIGKSYFINKLRAKLVGRRVCFYRSLRGIISTQQYLNELIRDMKEVAKSHSNLDYQLKRFLESHPVYQYETLAQLNSWFQDLTITLSKIGLDFLFVFDDIHEWEDEEEMSLLFEHFRILNQASNCQMILASNRNTSDKIEDFKINAFKLNAIPIDSIWQAPVDWQKKAYEYSQGNTIFLIEIIEYCENHKGNFETAQSSLMNDYHPVLGKIKKRFTKLQWRLLRAIAFEEIVEQPHSFEFLVRHKLGAASSVERALRNLSDSQMIIKTEKGWKLSNIIYQRWLQWLYSKTDS